MSPKGKSPGKTGSPKKTTTADAKKATSKAKTTAKKAAKKTAEAPAKKTAKKAAKTPARKTAKKTAPATKATAAAPRRKTAKKKKKARRKRRSSLTPRQLKYYQELLLEKQRGLTEAYYLSKGNSRSDLDDGTEDYIDYAVHSYAREFLLSLTELDRKQLFLVEEALERFGRGEFGHCQHCQRDIHEKRLEVAPWARYCVPCQELEEKGLLPQFAAAEDEGEDEEAEELGDRGKETSGPEYEGELEIDDKDDAEALDTDGSAADSEKG